jgi:nucleotide-binding universal stress UspA family protein
VVSSERPDVFDRILAGTDGSERAEEAVGRAARLASVTAAALDLVYVIDTRRPHDEAEVEPKAEAVLHSAEAIAARNVPAGARVVAGDPAEALVEEAADHAVDVICVGPDAGLLGGRVRIGGVAAHVLRHAPCSVLVGREAGSTFPVNILCGVDGSNTSIETAGLAARIAVASGAELRLQHVVPVFEGDERGWTLDDDEPDPTEIESAAQAARAVGARPIRERALGRPEYSILEAAGRERSDLVVVGSHGISGVARVLLGSVSEYVATHAYCSALVVRHTAGRSRALTIPLSGETRRAWVRPTPGPGPSRRR